MINPFSGKSDMGIRKRVLSLLLVVLVPLLLLQALTFYNWYRHDREEELQSNLELARTVAKTFEAFVNDVLSTQRAIGLAATSSPPLADASLLAIMRAAEEKYPMLRSFSWISPEGVHRVTTNPAMADRKVENWEDFSRAASAGTWTVSPVFVSPWTKDRVFVISRPVLDPQGGLLGVVACAVAADKLDSLFAVQRAKGAGLSLIDSKGMHVYRYPSRPYTSEQMNWLERYPVLRDVLRGKEAPFRVTGTGGEIRLGAFVPIPSVGWVAAASRAESEVFAAVTRTLLPQAILTLIVTVFALGAAVFLYRPLIASISNLRNHAAAFGRGESRRVPLEECPAELRNLAGTMNEMEEKIRLREAELRESGERWATTLASIGDAVISTDSSGRVTFMNKVAEELTGWAGQDAALKPVASVFNIINEKTRQRAEDPVAKVLKEGAIVGLANHTVLLRKDGTEVPIDDSGAPIRGKDGKVAGVVLVFRDITERQKADRALRESEAKANALVRFAPTGIYEIDYRGPSFISVNDAMCQILGYTREELFRIGPSALLDETGRARFADRIRRQLAGEKIDETVEFRVRKKDGSVIDAILNVSLDFSGEPGRALVVAHDITERNKAADVLHATVQRFFTVLSGMYAAILLVGDDNRVEFANQAFCDFFGLKDCPESLAGFAAPEMIAKLRGAYLHSEEEIVRIGEIVGRGEPVRGEEIAMRGGRTCLRDFVPIRVDGKSSGRLWVHTEITGLKRAEESLRRGEAMLARAERIADVGSWEWDIRSGQLIWSSQTYRIFGVEEGKFFPSRDAFLSRVLPEDRPLAERVMAGALADREPYDLEFRVLRPDSSIRWLHSRGEVVFDEAGSPGRMFGAAADITERRRAEEALRESEERFRRYFELGLIGMAITSPDKGMIEVNDEMCKILGYDCAELRQKTWTEMTHPEDLAADVAQFNRVLAGEIDGYALDKRWVRKDGRVIDSTISVRALRRADGTVDYFVALVQDITERKRAEEALRQSEAILRAVLDSSPDAIFLKDRDCRLRMANRATFAIVGKPAEAMIGKTDAEFYDDPATGRAIMENDRRVMDRGKMEVVEETVPDPAGARVYLSTKAPYFNAEGRVVGLVGVAREITARKKAEEELRKAKEELEVRVKERTEELAKSRQRLQHLASQLLLAQEKERKRVAVEVHDGLLSELAAMKMLFEAKMKLLEQGKLADLSEFWKVSDILARVMKEARGIMNNLHPSALDELGLIAAVNWMSGEYQKAYPGITVQKRFEVAEQDISDSVKVVIYRVLQEALNNFAKHGKGDRVELSLAKTDGSFALTIRDNGKGFDMEKAQKGLGLESMRERVELSGGKFQVDSAAGRGTTIRAVWNNS